jgi:hypothetical protein
MKVYKIIPDYNMITQKGLNPCIESDSKNIFIWFEEAEPGEKILIEVMEMPEKEYEKLPDYMGP